MILSWRTKVCLLLLFALLIYTRFVGLDWGLPYPMHPDERNMAISILQLQCSDVTTIDCFHPHFFAYGQLPIYSAYIIAHIIRTTVSHLPELTFEHVTMALRLISAGASIVTAVYLTKLLLFITKKMYLFLLLSAVLMITFVPAFIQFSHFGTTESLLMMFYTILLYNALLFLKNKRSLHAFMVISGIALGMAAGTKISSGIFVLVPLGALLFYLFHNTEEHSFLRVLFAGIQMLAISIVFFILTSPYNLIAWSDFLGSMNYESSVGFGTYRAFYTRQFEYTVPFLFQFIHIFPYSLGGPFMVLFLCGFFFLPWNKEYNFLRLQFLFFLIPTATIYAKWTRFISPVFPLMIAIGILFFIRLLNSELDRITDRITAGIGFLIALVVIIPGLAYLSVYQNPDVRFIASKWVYEHIPEGSEILSETANVVDIPIPSKLVKEDEYNNKHYSYISFNSYDLDQEPPLQEQHDVHTYEADYIFIPSRRVFYNHTCYRPSANGMIKVNNVLGYKNNVCKLWKDHYPLLNRYYSELFSGNLEFQKVAEFHSYPRIELFGMTLLELPDEAAEETWTVFDHPVIRIYKNI